MIDEKIEIICQNCFNHYFIPSSRARWILDNIIDSSVCPHCHAPRVPKSFSISKSKQKLCKFVIEGIQCNAQIKSKQTYCHTHYMQLWRKRKSQEK